MLSQQELDKHQQKDLFFDKIMKFYKNISQLQRQEISLSIEQDLLNLQMQYLQQGYEFCPMTDLPRQKSNLAELGKFYLSLDGNYVVVNNETIHQGHIDWQLIGIVPDSMFMLLNDLNLKKIILQYTDAKEHTNTKYRKDHHLLQAAYKQELFNKKLIFLARYKDLIIARDFIYIEPGRIISLTSKKVIFEEIERFCYTLMKNDSITQSENWLLPQDKEEISRQILIKKATREKFDEECGKIISAKTKLNTDFYELSDEIESKDLKIELQDELEKLEKSIVELEGSTIFLGSKIFYQTEEILLLSILAKCTNSQKDLRFIVEKSVYLDSIVVLNKCTANLELLKIATRTENPEILHEIVQHANKDLNTDKAVVANKFTKGEDLLSITQAKELNMRSKISIEQIESYICPITYEPMKDPVMAADGHTYERAAIEEWLQTNSTSPLTRGIMENKDLKPNLTLKSCIEEFLNIINKEPEVELKQEFEKVKQELALLKANQAEEEGDLTSDELLELLTVAQQDENQARQLIQNNKNLRQILEGANTIEEASAVLRDWYPAYRAKLDTIPCNGNLLANNKLVAHEGDILYLELLSNNRLASASADRTIKIWDLKTQQCLQILTGHTDTVRCLQSLDNNLLASGSFDATIKIWNLATGKCIATLLNDSGVRSIMLLEDGKLASGSKKGVIKIWDLKDYKESLSFNHTEAMLPSLLPSFFGKAIRGLNALPGNKLASCSGDSTIKIWDKDFVCMHTLKGHDESVNCIELLSDNLLVSGSQDKSIKIWDIQTGKEIKTINSTHGRSINFLQVLPGNNLASCSADQTIEIRNLDTGILIKKFLAHGSMINSLQLLPGSKLASGSDNGVIKFWDLSSLKQQAQLQELDEAATSCKIM